MDHASPPPLLTPSFVHIHDLLLSAVSSREGADQGPWRVEFAQLVTLIYQVLCQADQAGKRVDFIKGVGVNGKIQDITSLVGWVYDRLPDLLSDQSGQWPQNRLNRFVDAGVGYFSNGVLFVAEFDHEVTYYVDDQRLYLNHHLKRAVDEAECNLR